MPSLIEIVEWENKSFAARLFRARFIHHPNASKFLQLTLDRTTLPPLDTRPNVEEYGRKIREAFRAHPAIDQEITQILHQFGNRGSLQFYIDHQDGESLRWETVIEPNPPPPSFLALQNHCAISRLANLDSADSITRLFSNKTLRLAAFLSPAQVNAATEFNNLCTEIKNARALGLNIECTAYLGEQTLLNNATTSIAAGALPGIVVKPIPFDTVAFDRCLCENPAELLHFFCHGESTARNQVLELASINDWETAEASGSIRLSIERLCEILQITRTTWVTVLNSCSGGYTPPQTHSMALKLAKHGSPIAVGMAEPISNQVAPLFSQAFYQSLFDLLNTQLTGIPIGGSAILDLAPAVINARQMIHQTYQAAPPDAFGGWALPLLYEHGGSFVVQSIDKKMKDRIDAIAGALRIFPSGTPDDLRDDVLALLDKEPSVPASLRPNRFGVFS